MTKEEVEILEERKESSREYDSLRNENHVGRLDHLPPEKER